MDNQATPESSSFGAEHARREVEAAKEIAELLRHGRRDDAITRLRQRAEAAEQRLGAAEAALRTAVSVLRALYWQIPINISETKGAERKQIRELADELEAALPPQPPRMEITYELGNKFWHTNCPKNSFRNGIMRCVSHEPKRSLIECLHCGQQGYYPVGSVGPVCAEIVGGEAALPPQEPTAQQKLDLLEMAEVACEFAGLKPSQAPGLALLFKMVEDAALQQPPATQEGK